MTENLIELVRIHPCLYNLKDKSYQKRADKTKLWEQIGKEINVTGDVARKKWKSLRDNYIRYKKEAEDTTIEQSAKKFTKWPWASQLQFLDTVLTDRKRSSTVRQSTPDIYSSETPSPEIPPSEMYPAYSVIRSRAKKIKKIERNKVTDLHQNKKIQEYDAIDHLFQSYAQTFKSFSKEKQIKAKVELANLFATIETEEIQENKQKI